MDIKICKLCGNEFNQKTSEKYCPECIKQHGNGIVCSRKRYQRDHKATINLHNRIRNSWQKFNFTLDNYNTLTIKQKDRCAGCGEALQYNKPNAVHVDHDHTTNKARGLLCHSCNTSLAHANDSITRLNGLIAYLIKHTNKGTL